MEKKELLKTIGANVKKYRLQQNLTQVDLVGRMSGDIDTTNISRIEAGRTNPTLYTLFRISNALNVSLKDLVDIDVNFIEQK